MQSSLYSLSLTLTEGGLIAHIHLFHLLYRRVYWKALSNLHARKLPGCCKAQVAEAKITSCLRSQALIIHRVQGCQDLLQGFPAANTLSQPA